MFGNTIEANISSIDSGSANTVARKDYYYGNYHGAGHVLSALINTKDTKKPGVMFNTTTAQRDPFFYRWHKEVDNQWYHWEENLEPEDFSDYPKVQVRKGIDEKGNAWSPDIILVNKHDFPGADAPILMDRKKAKLLLVLLKGMQITTETLRKRNLKFL